MKQALDQFQLNIQRTRTLAAINSILKTRATKALDTSDILRSALVLAVSALDQYIHELVRIGLIEIFRGKRNQTVSSLKFEISLGSAFQIRDNPKDDNWLDAEIKERHSWQSFEQPDKIADAIRLISDIILWDNVASDLNLDASDVKHQLSLIVDRRNKIAHEADINPSYPNLRWPINEQMVGESIDFIEKIVNSIYKNIS